MNSTTQTHITQRPALANVQNEGFMIDLNCEKKDNKNSKFAELMMNSVDSALGICCGSASEFIYQRLWNGYGLAKESIPENVETFANALEGIFGEAALLIEARIMQEIHTKADSFRHRTTNAKFTFLLSPGFPLFCELVARASFA